MFAGILDGMHAQDAKNTTNRREAAKLFNEHLKNQSDLGIAVTEESLSDAWNSNSGGVMQRYAPTQQRLQSIVTAQNKSLAEKQLVSEINQLEQDQKIRAMNESSLQGFFKTQARRIPTATDISTLRESLGTNQLLLDDFDTYTGSGTNIAAMQSAYDRDQQAPEMEKVVQLIATMKTPDAELLKKVYTNVDPAFIDNAVAQAQKGIDQKDKEFEQADILFAEGRTTFKNQQVIFNREEQDAILSAAQLVKDRSFTNTSNEMTLEAAKEAVTRLVIEQNQADIVFGREGVTFRRDITKDILTAADLVITRKADNARNVVDDAQKGKDNTQKGLLVERANANYPADQLELAYEVVNRQVKVNAATKQSVIAALAGRGITDQDTIDNTWNLVNATQSQQLMTEMTQIKGSNAVALAKEEAQISILIKEDVKTNQDKIANHMNAMKYSEGVVSASNIVSARFIISGREIGYFQDYVKKKVADGSWENASQVEILDSMAEFVARKNPTFASKQAELVAQAKLRIGPDPYTPLGYKGYVNETTDEFNVHLKSMETAIENKNLTDFKVAKGALTSLLIDMQADTKARKSNPQKVFGKTVTPEEVASSLQLMKDLVTDMATKGDMKPPEEAAAVPENERPFDDQLYRPPLNGTKRLMDMDFEGAMSVINASITRNQTNKPYRKYQQTMIESQKLFITLVEAYDIKAAELKTPNLSFDAKEQINLSLSLMSEEIREVQDSVTDVIRNIQ